MPDHFGSNSRLSPGTVHDQEWRRGADSILVYRAAAWTATSCCRPSCCVRSTPQAVLLSTTFGERMPLPPDPLGQVGKHPPHTDVSTTGLPLALVSNSASPTSLTKACIAGVRPPGPHQPLLHLGSTQSARDISHHRLLRRRPHNDPPSHPTRGVESMRVAIRHSPTRRQLGGIASIAAPLLAAAPVTVIGVIVQQPGSLAFPTVALTALSFAAAALIISINASIWAAYCDE